MFKKLLANLSFNPGLLEEVMLYQKQVKKEAQLRFYGLLLVILAILLQAIASVGDFVPIEMSALIVVDSTLLFITTLLYARSRLIAKELEIIRRSFISAGGM